MQLSIFSKTVLTSKKKKKIKDATSYAHSQYKLSFAEALKMLMFELPDKVKKIIHYLQILRSDTTER